MIDPGIVSAIKLGVDLLPSVATAIAALVQAGFSEEDAKEIVKRDIESRASVYASLETEALKALARKHGISAELAVTKILTDDDGS